MTYKDKGMPYRLLLAHALFLFASTVSILGKHASFENVFSFKFTVLFGAQLVVSFVYSVFWQIALRKIPLTLLYANRGIITIWGLIWGILLFDESISVAKVIAATLIVSGIVVINKEDE